MANIRKVTTPSGLPGLALDGFNDALLASINWDSKGELLKPGSRSTVTKVKVEDTLYVFKQYKSLRLHRRIRYALTRSRARQSWENGQTMADLGLPVVRPLAFFEESFLGIPGRSLLIMPFQKGTPLDEFSALDEIVPRLKETFQKMAENEVTHGDLKATNIIVDDQGQPHFIDIDASRIHRSADSYLKARAKDEARFLRNWRDSPEAGEIFRDIFE